MCAHIFTLSKILKCIFFFNIYTFLLIKLSYCLDTRELSHIP